MGSQAETVPFGVPVPADDEMAEVPDCFEVGWGGKPSPKKRGPPAETSAPVTLEMIQALLATQTREL